MAATSVASRAGQVPTGTLCSISRCGFFSPNPDTEGRGDISSGVNRYTKGVKMIRKGQATSPNIHTFHTRYLLILILELCTSV